MDDDKIFEPRRYLHFDTPRPRRRLKAAIEDPQVVAGWRFYPLIKTEVDRSKVHRLSKVGAPIVKPKMRPICAAAHSDSSLYAFYARKLTAAYEGLLAARGLTASVTAFRTLGKSNIDFAIEAFQWIEGNVPCVALAYDVKGFFDSLNHKTLKAAWACCLGVDRLPSDHYAIYRSLTRYSYVDRDKLYKALGISKYNPRAHGRRALCDPKTFRALVKPLLHTWQAPMGIPQGTPISAVLSNIYMLDFDAQINAMICKLGGIYRRYCDDILCILPKGVEGKVAGAIGAGLNALSLELQTEKCSAHTFENPGERVTPALQYLGLTFDGVDVRLRSAGFGRYYNKLRSAVRGARDARNKAAASAGLDPGTLRIKRKKLNEKFSYLGRRNFVSYALRAAKKADSKAISKQIKRHWSVLNRTIKQKE